MALAYTKLQLLVAEGHFVSPALNGKFSESRARSWPLCQFRALLREKE
jgi:hypothetical protein